MADSILSVYHFHNGGGGGVLSVIKNLVFFNNNTGVENHIIYTINSAITPVYHPEAIEGAISQQVFYYNPRDNFYHTCRQLAKLLPDQNALIAAHDWLELGMVSNLGLQNPVVQIVHGNYEYYYGLAVKHSEAIDKFIVVSPVIKQKLFEHLPLRPKDIFYINFPVPSYASKEKKFPGPLKIIFYAGDLLDINKQFSTVTAIASLLRQDAPSFFFTIAGGGLSPAEFFTKWPSEMKQQVKFTGPLANSDIIDLLQDQHIFLLPSKDEGFPVSLVECMKCGVVPLTTDWEGSTRELVEEGVTGFNFHVGDAEGYAERIKNLQTDPGHLILLSQRCIERSNQLFDPVSNAKKYIDVFIHTAKPRRVKKAVKVYGSRLDKSWISNIITSTYRKKKR